MALTPSGERGGRLSRPPWKGGVRSVLGAKWRKKQQPCTHQLDPPKGCPLTLITLAHPLIILPVECECTPYVISEASDLGPPNMSSLWRTRNHIGRISAAQKPHTPVAGSGGMPFSTDPGSEGHSPCRCSGCAGRGRHQNHCQLVH